MKIVLSIPISAFWPKHKCEKGCRQQCQIQRVKGAGKNLIILLTDIWDFFYVKTDNSVGSGSVSATHSNQLNPFRSRVCMKYDQRPINLLI